MPDSTRKPSATESPVDRAAKREPEPPESTAPTLCRLPALELAAAIRDRRVSAREAIDAHLGRIAQVNDSVNAVRVVLATDALAAAREADRRLVAGDEVGPLHGVPFTVKENHDVAGSATTHGLPALAEARATVDSPAVAGLRAAGAIPIGRTNMPDLGLRWHTHNGLAGDTLNPWHLARTPGGSCGGEAAALATAMSPLGIGDDLGGSLRWPAQCCGIVALKPSTARVARASEAGAPPGLLAIEAMTATGPLARSVADLRVCLGLMIGADPRDPWHIHAPFGGPPAPHRVMVTTDVGSGPLDPDVLAALERAAAGLAAAGYELVDTSPPQLTEAVYCWAQLVRGDIARLLPLVDTAVTDQARAYMAASLQDHPDLLCMHDQWTRRSEIAQAWSVAQQAIPLILGPVAARQPFEIGWDLASTAFDDLLPSMALLVAVNLLGLPAVAVSAGHGTLSEMPQAVQLIGPRFREDLCLDAAEVVEASIHPMTPLDPRDSTGRKSARAASGATQVQ